MIFKNRQEAGQKLTEKLQEYKNKNAVILALPRGGVVVGYEVSKALNIPLNVLIVRKIGSPNNPEFAIGALAEGDIKIIDADMARLTGADYKEIEQIISNEIEELNRRIKLYRGGKPLPDLKNKTVILVDDGLATGMTMKAAVKSVKAFKPNKLIAAVPVCSCETAKKIKKFVDILICLDCEENLTAIGLYYEDFKQVTDEEVIDLLKRRRPY